MRTGASRTTDPGGARRRHVVCPSRVLSPPAPESPVFVGKTALEKNPCSPLVRMSDIGYSWGMTSDKLVANQNQKNKRWPPSKQ